MRPPSAPPYPHMSPSPDSINFMPRADLSPALWFSSPNPSLSSDDSAFGSTEIEEKDTQVQQESAMGFMPCGDDEGVLSAATSSPKENEVHTSPYDERETPRLKTAITQGRRDGVLISHPRAVVLVCIVAALAIPSLVAATMSRDDIDQFIQKVTAFLFPIFATAMGLVQTVMYALGYIIGRIVKGIVEGYHRGRGSALD